MFKLYYSSTKYLNGTSSKLIFLYILNNSVKAPSFMDIPPIYGTKSLPTNNVMAMKSIIILSDILLNTTYSLTIYNSASVN